LSKPEDKDDTIVNFEALDAEKGGEGSPDEEQKMKAVLTFLKEKLEPEDYSKFLEDMGIKDEMSNVELFDAIKVLLKGKEENGDGDGDGKDVSYKDFMKECLGEGKNLKECSEEFKKKYPEPAPKDEEIAEVEELAKELAEELAKKANGDDDDNGDDEKKKKKKKDEKDDLITDLQKRLSTLEKEKELAGVSAKVENLIKAKHLAPIQREMVIKLASKLNDEDQGELLEFFEKTQKFSVNEDVGHLESGQPGAPGGINLTPERKMELLDLHGLTSLIQDKADQNKLPWRKEMNN